MIGVLLAPAGAGAGERVLVATSDGARPSGAHRVAELAPGLVVWSARVPRDDRAAPYARRLTGRAGVVAAQPNHRLRAAQTGAPGTCSVTRPEGVDMAVPRVSNALGVSTPSTRPIAILDTGISPDTPELAGRVVSPASVVGGSGADDRDGHGTQVAGIAAAAPGAMQGISPTSPVMPVKIFEANGETTAQALVSGIEAALDAGAGVINISGAAPAKDATPADVSVVQLAITAAYARGALVVVAAGNDGSAEPYVPGNLPHVLTVGSGTALGGRESFSNTGAWIDVVAVGSNINAPMPPSLCSTGFGPANGTSYSAPVVSGAAALVQALRPELSQQQLFDLLRSSAQDIQPAGHDTGSGFGAIDVGVAATAPSPEIESAEVDDDPFWVRGAFAPGHPVLLRRARLAFLGGRLSSAKDLSDVYRVFARRGERLRARISGAPGALLDVSIWDSGTGDFDITRGVERHLIGDSLGFSRVTRAGVRVRRTGTYFVVAGTAELPDPLEDPDADAPRPDEPYRLKIVRRRR